MFKLFVLAAVLFVAVSAEPEAKPQIPGMMPYNSLYSGAYHHLDAYKYNPYSYDATKYPYNYGSYPYAQFGARSYPYQTGYPYQHGMYPYSSIGQHYPNTGIYNSPFIGKY